MLVIDQLADRRWEIVDLRDMKQTLGDTNRKSFTAIVTRLVLRDSCEVII